MTPMARSLVWLRRQGFIATPVERWVARVQRRVDCFGCGDILVAHPRLELIALIQATTDDHLADRLAKAKRIADLAKWVQAGGAFEVHGWSKQNGRWRLRRVGLVGEDLRDCVWTPRGRARRVKQKELF